eukprot:sb/3462890/
MENRQLRVTVNESLNLVFDGHRIFKFVVVKSPKPNNLPTQGLRVEQIGNDNISQLRRKVPDFSETNRAWFVAINTLHITFPYNYGRDPANPNSVTFANAYDEAQNCFKMLKALHRTPRLASEIEPLYADCVLNINTIKCAQMGSAAPDSIAPCLAPQTPSEHTFKSGARQEELGCFVIEDLQLNVLADESLNGHERVVDMINRLDYDSEVPGDLRFTTLWGRHVSGSCSLMQFKLRDYPTELWKFSNMSLTGFMCGAEAVSPNHAIRKTKVVLKKPWKTFELARGMNPLKFFYNLDVGAEVFDMGWGACLEPAYQFFGQALDRITKKSLDPSPLLPFWDKFRNILRGDLRITSPRFTMKLLSERDPLNSSEYLSLCSEDFVFTWTNGRLVFEGDTVIKNNSENKYGECQFMTLPKLTLSFDMIWTVRHTGHPDDHWSSTPHDPRFIKPSTEKWDSYRDFRSLYLDLRIGMRFAGEGSFPRINLYSNTLKWLDSWWVAMSTVSRPVYKGPLWCNLKPPKQKMARHLRRVEFETMFDQAEAEVWTSFRKRAGARLTVGAGSLLINYKLSLSEWPPYEHFDPISDEVQYIVLSRRLRMNWETDKCLAHLNSIQCVLLGSAGEEDIFDTSSAPSSSSLCRAGEVQPEG